ncbi:MAG TPA: DUF2779 domain-containing protein [Candidatus Angelobacter sp.]
MSADEPSQEQPNDCRDELFISKSKYLCGLQCHKLLWHAYNAKHLIPGPDAGQQAIFDQGHEVGELSRQLFPGGAEVAQGIEDFDEILAASKQAVKQRCPLYEADFAFNGGYARADILNPAAHGLWDLIEVKSTACVKDVHLYDLAFQTYVLAGAGLRLRRCIVAHINSGFVRNGTIDPHEFFVLEDVTGQVSGMSRDVESRLDDMFSTIRLGRHPDIVIGRHCDDPYPCPLHDLCWGHLPESDVTTLYRGGKKGLRLLQDGIAALKDIPNDFKLTDDQEIQRQAARTGQPHVDKRAIARFLRRIKFPASYLDFETFGTAIPLFDRLRPYQQVPFQFSLHVLRSKNAALEHHSFLADGKADPRPEFMRCLGDVLPRQGSVVAFNAPFELGRLKECSELLPEFRPCVAGIKRRIVDLLLPFRRFHYYHPQQNGNASMKAVLPALTGRGYDQLAIQDGGMASQEFLRGHFGSVTDEERERVRRQLEEYCGLDTMGMIQIVDALRDAAG